MRIRELELKKEETELSIEKAKLDQKIAAAEAEVAAAEKGEAEVMVERHQLRSPLTGVVVDVRAHKGEAVQPSQAVIRVVRLDSLWVQGDVPAAEFARSTLDGHDVTINVAGEKNPLPGKVVFVRPLMDQGNTFMVRARVDNFRQPNGDWLLHPGMRVEMNIQRGR